MIGDELTWANPELIHLVWLAVAIVVGLGALELARADALTRFLSPVMQTRLATRPTRQRVIARLALLLVALVAGVMALRRPQTPGDAETVTRTRNTADIMVVLDVSKSMLAADVSPSRLGRAQVEIANLVALLPSARVGLVAFAGRAAMISPLTADHAFFNLALRGTDTRTVSRGGTRIGDALRTAIRAFPPGKGARLIVLITDGEDHESFPLDAAKEARDASVHVISIGLGSETGAPLMIPDPKTGAIAPLMHDGQQVISRLDGDTLRQIATTTEGAYVPVGTAALDLRSIVDQHIVPLMQEADQEATRVLPNELYPWWVLIALVALCGAIWVGASTGERRLS